MINLSEKLGEMTFARSDTDHQARAEVRGGVIRKLSARPRSSAAPFLPSPPVPPATASWSFSAATAKENETLTPDCILCDDIDVGTRCRREGSCLHRRLLRHRQGDGLGQLHHHRG